MEKFEMTKDHLKLLSRMHVRWGGDAPEINSKYPYGGEIPEIDIAEILGWELSLDEDGYEELSEEQEELASKLHRETETALQIVLITQSFKEGVYERKHEYVNTSWFLT
jgi:hypothetical protein